MARRCWRGSSWKAAWQGKSLVAASTPQPDLDATATGLFYSGGGAFQFVAGAVHRPKLVPFDWDSFADLDPDKGDRLRRAVVHPKTYSTSNLKVVIEQRSSTPGLGLVLWVKDAPTVTRPRRSGLIWLR